MTMDVGCSVRSQAIELLIEQQAADVAAEAHPLAAAPSPAVGSPPGPVSAAEPGGQPPSAPTPEPAARTAAAAGRPLCEAALTPCGVSPAAPPDTGDGAVSPMEGAVSPTEDPAAAAAAGKTAKVTPNRRKTRHQPPRHRTCVCGSGKKFKQCCGSVQGRAAAVAAAAKPPDRQLAQLLI